MPDLKIVPWYRHTPMDAGLAIPSTGQHLFCLNDGQRYIVRRLLELAHREENFFVSWNADGTYTTPSATELDDIFANTADLEDELMSTLTYQEEDQIVALVPSTSGSVSLSSAGQTLGWVRIGNLIFVSGRLVVLGVDSPIGNIQITPLPFAVASGGGNYAAAAVLANSLTARAVTALQGYAAAGTQSMYLFRFVAGMAANLAEFLQANSSIVVGVHYVTDED